MNPFALSSVGASIVTLALSVWLLVSGGRSASLQNTLQDKQKELQNQQLQVQTQQLKFQEQQAKINQTNTYLQQVDGIIKDIGGLVIQKKNEKLRGLLAKYNIKVQEGPAGTPAPGATPAPAGAQPAPRP